jgi:hypothetical protein
MSNMKIPFYGKATRFESFWNNQPTKLIRVPENLADQIINYARQLDNQNNFNNNHVTGKLKAIVEKIENQEKGYKSNSATALIKNLKKLMKDF